MTADASQWPGLLELAGQDWRLTPAVIQLLSAAIGFRTEVLVATRWRDYRRHWFGRLAMRLRPHTTAIVWGRWVLFDAEATAVWPPEAMFGLIAHEQAHRMQINREGFMYFYLAYSVKHIRRGYQRNPYEQEAYAYGLGKDALAARLWRHEIANECKVGDLLCAAAPDLAALKAAGQTFYARSGKLV